MFEQTRQHYLKQMGVTLWYSRCELPGAAASPELSFGDNVDVSARSDVGVRNGNTIQHPGHSDVTKPTHLDSSAGSPKSASSILSALASSSSDKSHEVSRLSPSEPPVDTPISGLNQSSAPSQLLKPSDRPTITSVESLNLMLWVGEKNWFLSDGDSEFPEQIKQQLLLNIASALGENTESSAVMCFKWPFFGNKRLPGNDPESMLRLVREWLGEQVKSDHLTGFLLGDKIADLLSEQSRLNTGEKMQELAISDERAINVVETLSLNDMLREPLSKRRVWQQMSPYRL